jgi:hypothetical protein
MSLRTDAPEPEIPHASLVPFIAFTRLGRSAFLPAALLKPGYALLMPFAQITDVEYGYETGENVRVTTVGPHRTLEFPPASWALALLPHRRSTPCPGCGRDWIDGCKSRCRERRIPDRTVAAALAASRLTAHYTGTELQEARPS